MDERKPKLKKNSWSANYRNKEKTRKLNSNNEVRINQNDE